MKFSSQDCNYPVEIERKCLEKYDKNSKNYSSHKKCHYETLKTCK